MEGGKGTCCTPKWMKKLLDCSRRGGGIPSERLPAIITELNPGLHLDEHFLRALIKQNNPDGTDILDFETVTRILFQLVLKQMSISEDDAFTTPINEHINQNEFECCCSVPGACSMIKVTDFIIFPTM